MAGGILRPLDHGVVVANGEGDDDLRFRVARLPDQAGGERAHRGGLRAAAVGGQPWESWHYMSPKVFEP